MNVKTYTNKSNAKRAAIAANGSLDGMELCGTDGAWYYDHIRTLVVDPKPQEVHPDVARLNDQLDASKARLKKSNKAPELGRTAAVKKVLQKAPKEKKQGTYAQLQASSAGTNSSVENPVRAMWDLCDAMTGNKRKDVIAAAVEQGINYYTARTQYQLWLTAWRNSNPAK